MTALKHTTVLGVFRLFEWISSDEPRSCVDNRGIWIALSSAVGANCFPAWILTVFVYFRSRGRLQEREKYLFLMRQWSAKRRHLPKYRREGNCYSARCSTCALRSSWLLKNFDSDVNTSLFWLLCSWESFNGCHLRIVPTSRDKHCIDS